MNHHNLLLGLYILYEKKFVNLNIYIYPQMLNKHYLVLELIQSTTLQSLCSFPHTITEAGTLQALDKIIEMNQ